jgi:formamidopyrimidine-DNA glycosylase
MPELPEVETLVQHLAPLLRHQTIRSVQLLRPKLSAPTKPQQLEHTLAGSQFIELTRRGKYLVFELRPRHQGLPFRLLAHLGMTGRLFLAPTGFPLHKHCAVICHLDRGPLVFEDPRGFGRFTLDLSPLLRLGPEPLSQGFTCRHLAAALKHSRQPIKVRLLDQSLIAGLGNIYVSETLFRAHISPVTPGNQLTSRQIQALWRAMRWVLSRAIRLGSSLTLDWAGTDSRNRLFYFGHAKDSPGPLRERFHVYDRELLPCTRCRTPIQRISQAGRSSFFCPHCQSPTTAHASSTLAPGKTLTLHCRVALKPRM